MSIRRQSCDSCFKGRRKCDLAYPICSRCERSNKTCHYRYPPQLPHDEDVQVIVRQPSSMSSSTSSSSAMTSTSGRGLKARKRHILHRPLWWFGNDKIPIAELKQRPLSPRWLGPLGNLQPLSSSPTWNWVFDQIRSCPRTLAERAETIFIHKDLYNLGELPQSLRMAFGICAASIAMTAANQAVAFTALDAEVSSLLQSSWSTSLLQDLANLQAMVLYQIIRLFYGNWEQRVLAERQEYLVRSYALKLLQRADGVLRDAPETWETWILAESVRRTVYIAFKLYTAYSITAYGACTEMAAMNMLPVSTRPVSTRPGFWRLTRGSDEVERNEEVRDEVVTYRDFTSTTPRSALEPFEMLILVGCKRRIEQVDGVKTEERALR